MKVSPTSFRRIVDVLKGLKAGLAGVQTKVEKEIAEKRGEMNIDVQGAVKGILQQEVAIYFEVYERVRQEVNAFATQVGPGPP